MPRWLPQTNLRRKFSDPSAWDKNLLVFYLLAKAIINIYETQGKVACQLPEKEAKKGIGPEPEAWGFGPDIP